MDKELSRFQFFVNTNPSTGTLSSPRKNLNLKTNIYREYCILVYYNTYDEAFIVKLKIVPFNPVVLWWSHISNSPMTRIFIYS